MKFVFIKCSLAISIQFELAGGKERQGYFEDFAELLSIWR